MRSCAPVASAATRSASSLSKSRRNAARKRSMWPASRPSCRSLAGSLELCRLLWRAIAGQRCLRVIPFKYIDRGGSVPIVPLRLALPGDAMLRPRHTRTHRPGTSSLAQLGFPCSRALSPTISHGSPRPGQTSAAPGTQRLPDSAHQDRPSSAQRGSGMRRWARRSHDHARQHRYRNSSIERPASRQPSGLRTGQRQRRAGP